MPAGKSLLTVATYFLSVVLRTCTTEDSPEDAVSPPSAFTAADFEQLSKSVPDQGVLSSCPVGVCSTNFLQSSLIFLMVSNSPTLKWDT